MAEPFPLQPSRWAATAPPAAAPPPLTEPAVCGVCVIGGGYAGLSSALHLAEVVVLEAEELGYGGSGRNGGQVIPGLKYDSRRDRATTPDEIERKFGPERGARLAQFAASAADAVFQLIIRHRLDVRRPSPGIDISTGRLRHGREPLGTNRCGGRYLRRSKNVSF